MSVLAPLLSSALRLSDPQAESHNTGQHLGAPLAEVLAAQHMMLFSESAQFELLLVFGVRYLEKALLVGELWIISCLLKYVGILENLQLCMLIIFQTGDSLYTRFLLLF